MSRIIEENWRELLYAMLVAWLGWVSLVSLNNSSHIQALELNSSNVIPAAVEKSLAEIRTRMNEEQKERAELMMLAHDNAKDITAMKDSLSRLSSKP
jgi:hypothetical protein